MTSDIRTSDQADATCLRLAARILLARGPRKTPFTLRVVVRVLQRVADRIETPGAAAARKIGHPVSLPSASSLMVHHPR